MEEAVGYWIAQFLGGLAGAAVLYAVMRQTKGYNRHAVGLGADGWGKLSMTGINGGGAFLAEVILTALFVYVVLAATGRKGTIPASQGIVIGFALTVVHLVGIPLTGTSVNPARSFGPALIVGGEALRQLWLFIVAPLVGGAIAAGVHELLIGEELRGPRPRDPRDAVTPGPADVPSAATAMGTTGLGGVPGTVESPGAPETGVTEAGTTGTGGTTGEAGAGGVTGATPDE